MIEYENVRDVLKELMDFNDPQVTATVGTDRRPETPKDVRQFNYELLANVCDLLGMSELYLEGDNHGSFTTSQ